MCAMNSQADRLTLSINDEPFAAAIAVLKSSRETFAPQLRSLADAECQVSECPVSGGPIMVEITWRHVEVVLARAIEYDTTTLQLLDPAGHRLWEWEGDVAVDLLGALCKERRDAMEPSSAAPSLDEIVARAIEALPSLELIGERLLALATSERSELVDFSFGDSELTWRAPGGWDVKEGDEGEDEDEDAPPNLAVGYDGSAEAEVSVFNEDGTEVATWHGEDAWPLLTLGRLHGRERNDESAELTPLDERYLAEREV